MALFRKKPVVIDAIQLKDWEQSANEIRAWSKRAVDWNGDSLVVKTLEGQMCCSLGDYVIKGVQGEFYPCKPDIFEQTYEAL